MVEFIVDAQWINKSGFHMIGYDPSRGQDRSVVSWSHASDPGRWTVIGGFCEWPLRRSRLISRGPDHVEAVNWRKAKRLIRKGQATLVDLSALK